MAKQQRKLEISWIGKENIPKLEPRILVEVPDLHYHASERTGESDIFDNMIIHGDNLLALKSLEANFTGSVQCIYIDPPFNVDAVGVPYDDNMDHSIWLSMMRDRLQILHKLLAESGTIVVHIDDTEQPYLRVLMNEIFGERNFVNCIVVQDSHPSGLKLSAKDKKIIKTKSYMVVYKKSDDMRITPIYKIRDDWDTHFNMYMDIDKTPLQREQLRSALIDRGVIEKGATIDRRSLQDAKFTEFCFQNRHKIFQSTKELPREARERSLETKDIPYEYQGADGERQFALNGRRMSPLSKSIWKVGVDGDDTEGFAKLLCDFWDDVDFNNSRREGGVEFPNSKKPELLVARVLTMFSNRGDLVLDSFAGSGTTGAVAHKMGRQWILVENGDHCKTHIVPRLQSVVAGSDEHGITKAVKWTGGGGYRFYQLAPSMLQKDDWGNWVISREYNPCMLAEAMCRHMGFKYAPDPNHFWNHGYSTETDFIYVTTNTLVNRQLYEISRDVGEGRTLLICCRAFSADVENFPNLTLAKIPQAVLNSCEWAHDDYSIAVANLPLQSGQQLPLELSEQPEEENAP